MARNTQLVTEVNSEIGKRIKNLRTSMGLSRMQLAKKISVTHQQLSKNELGTNRISAGRLQMVAKALNKPVSYFFNEDPLESPTVHQRMAIEVSRNFMKIKNPAHQSIVNNLIRELAK